MTSTEFTIGLSDRARASSKVLKPPGGGSSDIFGTQSSHSQPAARNADSTQNRLFGSTEPHSTANKPDRLRSNIFDDVPATSSPKSGPRKFVSRNPITGEVIEIKPTNGSEDGEAVQDDEVSEGVATNGADVNDNEIDNPETNATENSGTEVTNNDKDPVRGDGPEPARPTQACIRIRNPPGGKSSGIF